MLNNLSEPAKTLLIRLFAFIVLFCLLASLVGLHIMSKGVFFDYGFEYYGVLGKTLVFTLIALLLLIRKYRLPSNIPTWRKNNLFWLAAAIGVATLSLSFISCLANDYNLLLVLATHLAIIASTLLALLGCFGAETLRMLYDKYKKPFYVALGIGLIFLGFLELVYYAWEAFATIVLVSVRWLLESTGLSVTFIPPYTLLLSKFAITIEQGCSGIESIALFTGLYAIVGLLDWRVINHRKYIIVFPLAMLSLMGLNILRVYIMILGGYYVNEQIAFSLFHTYGALALFLLFSGVFWKLSYKWMLSDR